MQKLSKSKKGIGPIGLLVISIASLILLFVFGMFTWILNRNLFILIGTLLVVISTIMLLKGMAQPITVWVLFIGIAFLITPTIFKNVGGITLASVLP